MQVNDALQESTSDAVKGSKQCTLCQKHRNTLIRCQIDDTAKWHFVCTGKCWRDVCGGEIDARGQKDQYPYYRYGGMWKNRHKDGPMNARKPKKSKKDKSSDKTEQAELSTSDQATGED